MKLASGNYCSNSYKAFVRFASVAAVCLLLAKQLYICYEVITYF